MSLALGHLSPVSVLERGYAIVRTGRSPRSKVVRSPADVNSGQKLYVRLHEGDLGVRVTSEKKKTEKGGVQPTLFDNKEDTPR